MLQETTGMVKELIPEFLTDSDNKRTFLSWRLCGFSITESTVFAKIANSEFIRWQRDDELFQLFEVEVPKLRLQATQEILRQERDKNHRKFLEVESEVLKEAIINGVGKLSDNQMDILKTARSKYTPEPQRILSGENLPADWTELVLRVRRESQNGIADEEDPKSINEVPVVEAEYTESADKSGRQARDETETDDP
jgi:hypothetical protein